MADIIKTIIINTQPIELCKLLKIGNLVSGGGEAKIVISQGLVKLNGKKEFQKRKKVLDGDIIELSGEKTKAVFQPKTKEKEKVSLPSKASQSISNNEKTMTNNTKKQRKPINF